MKLLCTVWSKLLLFHYQIPVLELLYGKTIWDAVLKKPLPETMIPTQKLIVSSTLRQRSWKLWFRCSFEADWIPNTPRILFSELSRKILNFCEILSLMFRSSLSVLSSDVRTIHCRLNNCSWCILFCLCFVNGFTLASNTTPFVENRPARRKNLVSFSEGHWNITKVANFN